MPKDVQHPQIWFDPGVLLMQPWEPPSDNSTCKLITVPNQANMTNSANEPIGLVWLLWVDEFASENSIKMRWIDVANCASEIGKVILWLFETEEDADVFRNWQANWAPVYNKKGVFDHIYPWYPITHWKMLMELGYVGDVHVVETPVELFRTNCIDEWTHLHWIWMRKNINGRVWHKNGEFWFEDSRDAITYKMFLGGSHNE